MWTACFEADQNAKKPGDFEAKKPDGDNEEKLSHEDHGANQPDENDPIRDDYELPPEMAQQDEWDAEEEAARWLQGEQTRNPDSSGKELVPPTDPQGFVGAWDPTAQSEKQTSKKRAMT